MSESSTPSVTTVTAPLIDIGANLGHESFDHDLPEVIAAARHAGIEHIMVTGTDPASATKALELVEAFPNFLSATAGVHPHHAADCSAGVMAEIARLAAIPEVHAVGETGLDFNRDFSPRPAQEKAFSLHLALACEIGKPVFLHQRDAHERFLPILKEHRDALGAGGVVHCFTGTRDELYAYLDLDMHIGITGWICDERRGRHLLPLIKDIPADRLLLETDAPYLMPRTLRPKPKTRRNEPRFLPAVVETIAENSRDALDDIAHRTSRNANDLFGLGLDQLLSR